MVKGTGARHLFLWIVLVLLGLGCGASRNVPELLTLTELAPRVVGPTDRVDIHGRDLPVGSVGDAVVTLRGALYRPGEAPQLEREITIPAARVERDRVSFEMTDALLEQLTGLGDEAKHTTFRGTVEVSLPGAKSSIPVLGTLKSEIVLDVLPRAPSKRHQEAADARTAHAQTFFGWTLEQEPGAAGLVVRDVKPGGPAALAGIAPGDVVATFHGVTALAPSDVVPSGLEGSLSATVLRGDQTLDVTLDARGFRGEVEAGLIEGVVILATLLLLLLAFGTRLGAGLSWFGHRMREELHRHRSPGGGLVAALLRAAISDVRHGAGAPVAGLAGIAPFVVAAGMTLSFASLPAVELSRRAELDLGILYLLSVTALLSMGLVTGGFSTTRSIIGRRLRAVVEVIVCELPAACALAAVVVTTGSLRVRDVVFAQVGGGGTWLEVGSWPWAWNALKSPQLFVLFVLFFVTALVDGAGRREQRSQVGTLAFFFAEWTHVFVMCGLGTIAFLGGYAVPGLSAHDLYAGGWMLALGCAVFLLKCWALTALVLLSRAALPRIRPDILLRIGLRVLLPASLAGVAATFLVVRYPLLPAAERALGLVTMCTVVLLLVLLVGHVVTSLRGARPEDGRLRVRVNPIL